MKTGQDVVMMPKMEFDYLCPFCRSKTVTYVRERRTNVGYPEKDPAHSGIYVEEWCCAFCHRAFELF